MTDLRGILCAMLAAVLVSGAARAGAEPHFDGSSPTNTSYSGWAGAISEANTPTLIDGGKAAVYGIDWYEEGNQPCRIGMYSRTLTEASEVYTNTSLNNCSGTGGNRKEVRFADNPRYFVRGIALCSSKVDSNRKRMKGVKLYAAKVWLNKPEVQELTTAIVDDHANCGTWNAPVYCPANQVAVGLIAHRDGKSFTGLGLKCRPVRYD